MQLANQTFYFAIFIVLVGLMGRFLANRDDDRAQFRVIYWPIGLSFLAASMLGYATAPWGGKMVLALANIFLIAGVANISLLFSVWNGALRNSTRLVTLALFVSAFLMYVYLDFFGETQDRIHLMNVALSIFCIWQIVSLSQLLKKDNAYQIKLLLGVEFFQLGTRIIRSLLALEEIAHPGTLYQEGGLAFAMRIAAILSIVTICILITNYYLEKLWHEYRRSSHAIEDGMLNSLNALSMVRDNETGNHILRTKNYVRALAERLRSSGVYADELTLKAIENFVKAAPLHDIGKVGIPDEILKKPGSLTDDEWQTMKTHANLGKDVLSAAKLKDAKNTHVLDAAIKIAGCHHENWDGSGYPLGLKGDEIPLPARLMSLADTYDALVNERVYKKKWSHEEACLEISRLKGIRFDPHIVEAFIQEKDNFLRISELYRDSK
ncbi:HD-GYP domain-containing protein [Polynucleobacter sp. Tro8-14-1]|jgi:HD-GYP domain-containing protein (c-di-GMP phosphodiesterase class II)|uniref:HD-GYP domain-containing protein n=1 Tax=Polynucleobacter sp. Tro8-14-1 TaxID=1758383 RepID=UPI001C0C62DF|nr:HD domain-containing phosphohydrolase [Polynucleobacter sp. Tro8-14-1]MBU3564243.1 HD domain-containing protein [Polynucleobacter sp. Tro8-14-1]